MASSPPIPLPDGTDDQLAYALEYLDGVRHSVALLLIDPESRHIADRVADIREDLSIATQTIERLFGVQTPPTPRWLGQPEDELEDSEHAAALARERREFAALVRCFSGGGSPAQLAAVIDGLDRQTDR